MRVLNGFEVEQNPTKSCYKISGKDVPSDFEIRIRFENGKYKAEANYSKKPSSTATSTWQPRSLPFDSEEKALENILNYFASNNEPFVKDWGGKMKKVLFSLLSFFVAVSWVILKSCGLAKVV